MKAKTRRYYGPLALKQWQGPLTRDQQFFYDHAGYSYDPKKETREAGRRNCAVSYARAERYARNLGFEFLWEDDWDIGSHAKFYGPGSVYHDTKYEPSTCECCSCVDEDGNVLGSLCCIDDADANYRRVIEAELAYEAIAAYDRDTERIDAH